MTEKERKLLANAAIPLEVLCASIKTKPYKELNSDLQAELIQSLEIIRQLLFNPEEGLEELSRLGQEMFPEKYK